ncbi:MAG: DNA replication complex GINS family protein, partial [Methanomicrobia archaeon]|nr:DNA replication complex GINS family protein [Methanomicrobia archaeon]
MDIEKLWGILYKERNTASLQELPENFCEEVCEYMEKLKEEKGEADERRRELVEDELRNAKMKAEDIIRRRIGKIVKLASSGMKTGPKGMLEEEERIFEGVKSHV